MAKFKAQFPDHYDLPVAKTVKVTNDLGAFTVAVFTVGTDWRGKPEYEIELKYPGSDGGVSTTTRKFSSVAEAVERGKKMADEASADERAKAREAKKSPKQKKLERLSKEVQFFRENAGGIHGEATKGALALAKAEKKAEELGWTFEWNHEEGSIEDFLGDQDSPEDISEVLYAVVKDENGQVVGSLGGITFGHNDSQNKKYGRVVEAELALEGLTERGLL